LATPHPKPIALQGLTPASLCRAVPDVRLEEARKIVSHVARGGALGEPVRTVRRVAIEAVAARCAVPALAVRDVRQSVLDPFVKWALETHDGRVLETVRIPLERAGRYSVCVSSQVGCAIACTFCATGRMGLARNLEAFEIVEQVRVVARSIPRARGRVHGVVFQGMGEPLANAARVLEAIAALVDPCALAIDQRAITVCTSGLPAGIRALAREAPKVRLGLSIGSARREVRRRIMPIDDAHPLDDVLDAAADHARTTGLAPLWAVTLLAGVNDADEDAVALAARAFTFARETGKRPRITIVPYNRIAEPSQDAFARSSDERESAFRDILSAAGIATHKRYSGGADVAAACGQLTGAARPT
jgi:23S rRNA (adenine2503-C2)-methyltransferase